MFLRQYQLVLFSFDYFFYCWSLNGDDIPDMSDRALFITSSMMQFAGIMCLFIGILMYLCRDLEVAQAKKFLLASGIMLVIMDIIMIKDELAAMELYPNDPALHTPLPAIAIFLLLTVYSLYVALNASE